MIRVAFIGSECTGKTTLANRLGERYPSVVVEEYCREYAMRKKELTIDDVIPIMQGQIALEEEALQQGIQSGGVFMFCDTIPLSSVIYSGHYHGAVPPGAESLARRHYDLYFLTGIDVPWEADGVRDRPHLREEMHALFVAGLEQRNLPYISLFGSLEERMHTVSSCLERYVQSQKTPMSEQIVEGNDDSLV